MKFSRGSICCLVIASFALAPVTSLAQTPPTNKATPHVSPSPTKVKKAKKAPARPPHEDEKNAPTMTKEPPPPPIPDVQPHVPGQNPPPPPGSPPPESM